MARNPNNFDWNDLKLVVAIAEAGGLGKAAEALGLDATTVGRRLQRVETRLGTALFDRKRSGYQATGGGDMLLSLAARVEDDVRAVTRRISAGQSPRGCVRITTSDCVLEHLLIRQLPKFRTLYPEISISAIVGNSELNLSRDEADLALRVTSRPGETLAGRRIGSMAWTIYGAAHRWGSSDTIASFTGVLGARALATAQNWVTLGGDLSHARVAMFVHQHVDPRRIAYTVNSVSALAHAIEQDVGVGYLPCFVGDASPRLVRLEPPSVSVSEDLWLLMHPEVRRSGRVRAVIDFFLADILAKRTMLEGRDSAAQRRDS